MASSSGSLKPIFYALGANFFIALAKFAAAWYTRSGSMLAEAIHSLADCGNQGLLLLGLKRAQREPTEDHPLGYGKSIFFWSFIVALILFSVGGMFSIYEGLHKLQTKEPLNAPWVAVAVLVFGLVMESLSLYGCLVEVNKSRGTRSLWRWFRESRQSELIVIFGEDIAALFGLAFALGAILLTIYTGNPVYDALGSIAIGALLIVVAILLGVEIKNLLIGESADPHTREAIRAWLLEQDEVQQVFNLITMQLGTEIMVATKVHMREAHNVETLMAQVNRCEAALKKQFPEVKWLFFEPDVTN
jgi:cation diffusion facilitator family transporter